MGSLQQIMETNMATSVILLQTGLLIIALFSQGCIGASSSSRLMDKLFQNYTTKTRPICDGEPTDTIEVKVGLAIRQIMDLNEPRQILETNAWVRLIWRDCNLQWNQTEEGVSSLIVPYGTIWVPDITLYDNAMNELGGISSYRQSIQPDGTVYYNFPSIIKSMCKVDVTYFPFDIQACRLQFGSWSHHGFELNITKRNEVGDISSYVSNGEWEIVAAPAIRHEIIYFCCPEPYPDVTFYLQLRRKPLFYLLNLMFPCCIISTMAVLGFLLPPDSGEKVSLEITVLLSLAVFLLVVSETMPPTSENFPYVGMYFAGAMLLVALSCLMTVTVLNIHFKGSHGKKIPRCIRFFFLEVLGRLLCMDTHAYKTSRRRTSRDWSPPYGGGCDMNNIDAYDSHRSRQIPNGIGEPDKNINRPQHELKELNINQLHVESSSRQDMSGEVVTLLYKQLEILKRMQGYSDEKQTLECIIEDWQLLAKTVDRLFLVLFSLLSFGVTFGVLIRIATADVLPEIS